MDKAETNLKKKAVMISLVVSSLLFIAKLAAYYITNSAAVLSDALESIVNIIAAGFAYYSLVLATKPPDKEHPYGHGKIEFFSAGFEGALIMVAAITIIVYAVRDIIYGGEISSLDSGAVIITGASIISLLLGLYLIRTGKKTKSLVLIADGKHVITDAITSIGAVIALVMVLLTEIKLFDPIMAIILALNILWTGKHLVRESVSGLMNENDKRTLAEIKAVLEEESKKHPEWINIHRVRYWKSGDKYMIDFHLIVPHKLTISESHETLEIMEAILRRLLKTRKVELFIHFDPDNLVKNKHF